MEKLDFEHKREFFEKEISEILAGNCKNEIGNILIGISYKPKGVSYFQDTMPTWVNGENLIYLIRKKFEEKYIMIERSALEDIKNGLLGKNFG